MERHKEKPRPGDGPSAAANQRSDADPRSITRSVDLVLSRLEGVRRSGDGWVALCPCHDDREPSLSIGEGEGGKLLLKCFAGCTWDELRATLNLHAPNGNPGKVEVARYVYRDEDGRELYCKVRWIPREFKRFPSGAKTSLYGLERLRHVENQVLFISESEKDCDYTMQLDAEIIAVSSGGATTWKEEWADRIAKARPRLVAILEHNDDEGRKFARMKAAPSLAKRGLPVKVLSFEGAKGRDVADEIQDGLDLDQLLARVEGAPEWAARTEAGPTAGLALLTLGDLLSMPAETTSWVWEGRIPSGGLGGLFAKPKGGKSTMARCLALAVSRGAPFLDFPTSQGAVIYLGLEEKAAEVQAHFRALGATATDPIHVLIATAPADGLARLRVDVERIRPALIIIDTMSKLVRLKDGNDYAEVTRELEPVLALARETGAAVLFIHHLGKGERNDAGDAILGSTAIFAAVDTALLLKRTERYRTLSSIQRYGTDLEEITLALDSETRAVSSGGTREKADEERYGEELLAVLTAAPKPLTKDELFEEVEGRAKDKLRALKGLVSEGKVSRRGSGKKGDPYLFGLSENAVPPFPTIGGNGGMESKNEAQLIDSQAKDSIPIFPRRESEDQDLGNGILATRKPYSPPALTRLEVRR